MPTLTTETSRNIKIDIAIAGVAFALGFCAADIGSRWECFPREAPPGAALPATPRVSVPPAAPIDRGAGPRTGTWQSAPRHVDKEEPTVETSEWQESLLKTHSADWFGEVLTVPLPELPVQIVRVFLSCPPEPCIVMLATAAGPDSAHLANGELAIQLALEVGGHPRRRHGIVREGGTALFETLTLWWEPEYQRPVEQEAGLPRRVDDRARDEEMNWSRVLLQEERSGE